MEEITYLSLDDLKGLVENGVTLIDFNAPWCAPCQAQVSILDELDNLFKGKADIIKMDIDHCREIALSLGIQSIPTLIIYEKGREFRRFIGLQKKDILEKTLVEALTACGK